MGALLCQLALVLVLSQLAAAQIPVVTAVASVDELRSAISNKAEYIKLAAHLQFEAAATGSDGLLLGGPITTRTAIWVRCACCI